MAEPVASKQFDVASVRLSAHASCVLRRKAIKE
jgi:hypothetical protein